MICVIVLVGGMHSVNAGYTVLVRLVPDRVAEAQQALEALQPPFARTTTTHFATITILPAQTYRDKPLPATLMVATSFCGPATVHVRELVQIVGDELRAVFRFCQGFVVGCSNDDLEHFIRSHRHGDTFYSGMQNLSPADVRNHAALRDEIEAYIDRRHATGGFASSNALDVRREIQDHIRNSPELAWAQDSFAPPRGTFFAMYWRSLIAGAIVIPFLVALIGCGVARLFGSRYGAPAPYLGLALLAVIVFLGGLILSVRESEREQTYVAPRQPDQHVKLLAKTQNRRVINEMTIAGPIKEEAHMRALFMRIALWVVARVAEGVPWLPIFGLNAGINIPTVATARWIAADRGRRLVFISNYTNSAEPYVRDFIDVKNGALRINLVFGFGRGYPITKWIVKQGAAAYPNEFIYVVTANQQVTTYWYGPYLDLSIDNIKINRAIREGLFATGDESEARTWLRLL